MDFSRKQLIGSSVLVCVAAGLLAAEASAKSDISQNLFSSIEYANSNIEFDAGGKAKTKGILLGLSTSPDKNGIWGKFEYATNSKTSSDLYGGSVGGHLNFITKNNFYLNGFGGVGYTRIESGITNSDLNFITLPIGIEAGYKIISNLDVFANVGYKWMFDLTGSDGYYGDNLNSNPNAGKTLCNDGEWSNSTGSGTCSWHDGVADNQPIYIGSGGKISLGDAQAPIYGAGLRFQF